MKISIQTNVFLSRLKNILVAKNIYDSPNHNILVRVRKSLTMRFSNKHSCIKFRFWVEHPFFILSANCPVHSYFYSSLLSIALSLNTRVSHLRAWKSLIIYRAFLDVKVQIKIWLLSPIWVLEFWDRFDRFSIFNLHKISLVWNSQLGPNQAKTLINTPSSNEYNP